MRKKRSLTRQIMLMIFCLAAAAIMVCWVLNSTLLEHYYVMNKQDGMVEGYQTISEASAAGELQSADFDITFENICANGNITTVVLAPSGSVVRSSTLDFTLLKQELLDAILAGEQGQVVSSGDNYQLLMKNDTRLHSEYLVLIGVLEDGSLILMRTALESLRESAAISNRFLLIVGLITIGISCIAGGFLARRITRPILQLADISKKMVHLDFNAKYVHGGWKDDPSLNLKGMFDRRQLAVIDGDSQIPGNEIDLLGNHMNRLSETLERTISELKSANVELTKDIEKKTKIDEMRREFLSNVSHELKTPLALIQGYAEGLQECINDDEESRNWYCEVIIDEAAKMNRMVKKLLTLNQLEFGNDQVVMERFNITELIRGITGASRILLEQNGITLDLDGLDDVDVWGDEFKVEEVITNYLSNAINHCEGEKKICIFYTRKPDLLRVSVFNTGKPIPEEDIGQIWDKFYKVDKARTREYGGSGIGLSIVKAIMDSFHQECGVINHENGVEFWMELSTK